MARDGNGTYSLPEAAFVYDTVISETAVNSNFSDIATALTASIAKDGQTTPTANLPMGTFKHTGLGAGSAATDSANLGQIQAEAFIWCGTAGGTADALTLTPSPAITAYATGQRFRFKVGASASTGAITIAISGLTTKAGQFNDTALSASITLEANKYYEAVYDGAAFQLSRLSFYISTAGLALMDDVDAAAQRTTLGLAIGTNVQAYGATLTSLEGLSLAQGDILYATAADTLTNLAKGTAAQVLTMNAGATAPEWAAAAAVGYEFVDTASASASASIDLGAGVIAAGYDYILDCRNVQNSGDLAAADQPGVQYGTGAGPTYQTTGYVNSNSQNTTSTNETTARILMGGGATNMGGAAGEVWSATMVLRNLAANEIHMTENVVGGHFTDGSPMLWFGRGWRTTAEVVTGVRVLPGSGTFTSGTFTLYRRKNTA